jgi:hypothetical protein
MLDGYERLQMLHLTKHALQLCLLFTNLRCAVMATISNTAAAVCAVDPSNNPGGSIK